MSEIAWWTNVSELAAVLEVTSPDTAAQTIIGNLAAGLQAEFERVTGRQINAPTSTDKLTEYHNGNRECIHPRVTPVSSISRLWVDPTREFADATLVVSTLYRLTNNRVWLTNTPESGRGVVKLEYVGGYAALPADLKRVFHAELRKEWSLRKSTGIASIGVQGANVTVSQKFGLMDETLRVLDHYKANITFFA